ncbi:YciI family protein [Dechloromonas sp. ARDL1]|uniref:YciI family protein n=1 Tax=Dechloromonas sp. ARDL1 TaxID=3322121 RepID=UPI003DA77813
MLYVIIGEDRPGTLDLRMSVRPAHLERMQILQAEGRIILAGPFPAIDSPDPGPAGFSGSLIVADFPSLEAAKAWIEDDPYTTHGVFEKITVKPFKKVMPA